MLLNQYEIERYINIAADRADLRVVYEDAVKPRTDGKTVWLPKLTSRTTPEEAERYMWYVTHEASHNKWSNFEFLKQKAVNPEVSELAGLFNQLEDDNIDYINGAEFKGDRELNSKQVGSILPSLLEKAKKAKAEGRAEQMGEKWDNLMAMLAFESDFRSDYCISTSHLTEEFGKLINNKTERLDKLLSGAYKDKLRKLRQDTSMDRTEKCWNLAREIFEDVFEGDADAEEQKLKEAAAKDGDGKGDKGKGKGSGADGSGESSDKKGKARARGERGDGEGVPGTNKEMVEINYREWSTDPVEFVEHNEVSGGERVHYRTEDFERTGTYLPCPLKETYVVDYEKQTSNYGSINPRTMSAGSGRDDYYSQTYREAAEKSSDGFANKVRILLQIRSKGRTQYGTKSGSLHPSNLYRTTIQDAPGYNERVFKKKIMSDVLDTCVQIVIDGSGSMSGEKYANAMVAATHLSDTLGNTLHIPTEILGFTEFNARNCMFIFRSFDTKLLSKDRLLERIIHASKFASQNADGDSVMFAYHRIKDRKEKRKVMIVLSDGSPCGDRPGDLPAFTKEVVQTIERGKKVEIVGVGLLHSNVEHIYKDNQVIKKARDIEPALLKLIQRKIM